MRKFLQASAIAALCAFGAACASASASSRAKDVPALNVPPPPARIIEPAPEPMPEPVSELPAPPTTAVPAPPKPNRPRETPRATTPVPAEQKPADTAPDPAPVAQPPAAPPAQLRTPQTADAENAAKAVRSTIEKTNNLLKNINYQQLSEFRRKAYDDAQRFMRQADDAIKQGNLVFAQAVATKAETLARELSGK